MFYYRAKVNQMEDSGNWTTKGQTAEPQTPPRINDQFSKEEKNLWILLGEKFSLSLKDSEGLW